MILGNVLDEVAECFAKAAPEIANLPHVVCRYSRETIECLRSIYGARIGIWGAFPPYKEEGVFDESGDPLKSACFGLWNCPFNENAVLEYAQAGRSTSQYSMFVRANLEAELLQDLRAEVRDLSDYEFYFVRALRQIERLRWMYVPMWDENEFALAVFSDSERHVADHYAKVLSAAGLGGAN